MQSTLGTSTYFDTLSKDNLPILTVNIIFIFFYNYSKFQINWLDSTGQNCNIGIEPLLLIISYYIFIFLSTVSVTIYEMIGVSNIKLQNSNKNYLITNV